jgi:hypothetical protein
MKKLEVRSRTAAAMRLMAEKQSASRGDRLA